MDTYDCEFRIVADSAADLFTLEKVPFRATPLKIITSEKEYPDVEGLDIARMLDDLKAYKGRSSSSCPNTDEWLEAFGDARYIFAVTLTSGMSGSCNAARAAKRIYEEEHPGRHVLVVDSLSTGPGEMLLIEKLEQLIAAGMPYEAICREIGAYQAKTGLVFMLESLTNMANNGRVSPAVAKIAGFLGIRIVGKASAEGTLEPIDKCRGQKRSLDAIVKHLKAEGFRHGKVRIAHCFNESGAGDLKEKILEAFHGAQVRIYRTNALCSFYAERGGILVGFERA